MVLEGRFSTYASKMRGSMATRFPSMAALGLRMGPMVMGLPLSRTRRRGGGVEGGAVVVAVLLRWGLDAALCWMHNEIYLARLICVVRGCLLVGGRGPLLLGTILATRERLLGAPGIPGPGHK